MCQATAMGPSLSPWGAGAVGAVAAGRWGSECLQGVCASQRPSKSKRSRRFFLELDDQEVHDEWWEYLECFMSMYITNLNIRRVPLSLQPCANSKAGPRLDNHHGQVNQKPISMEETTPTPSQPTKNSNQLSAVTISRILNRLRSVKKF